MSFMILSSADRCGIQAQWFWSAVFFWSCLKYLTALSVVLTVHILGPPKRQYNVGSRQHATLRLLFDGTLLLFGLYHECCDLAHGVLDWIVYAIWILGHASFYSSVVCCGLAIAFWLQWCSIWLLDSPSGFGIGNANMLVFSSASFGFACLRWLIKLVVFLLWDIPMTARECISSSDLSELNHDITTILSRLDWSLDDDNPNDASSLTTVPAPIPPVHKVSWFKSKAFRFRRSMRLVMCLMGLSSMASSSAQHLHSDVVCFSTQDVQNPSAASFSSFVCHKPDKIDWRNRRRWRRKSERIEFKGPNPFACMAPPSPLTVPTKTPQSPSSFDQRVDRLIKSSNPATSGMQLLLTERMDRVLFRHKFRSDDKRVSVDLQQCNEVLFPPSAFPLFEEHVFNSISIGVETPLIVDTGASCCISPHREDFITYSASKVQVKDLSGSNKVTGEGMISWKVLDKDGEEVEINLRAYHMPKASVRLLSPQSLYKSISGSDGHQDAVKYTILLPGGITIHAPYGLANLPLLSLSAKKDQSTGFWNQCFSFSADDSDTWAKMLTSASNQNLTPAQKELLVWHHKLSHASLSKIHSLCRRKRKPKDSEVISDVVPYHDGPILPCNHNVPNAVRDNLLCASCAIAKACRRAPGVHVTKAADSEMVLKQDHLQPGDCISCDHYLSPVPGRVTADSGYSSSHRGYTCGTIYVDHASGFVFVGHQKTTSAEETIRSKVIVEEEARHFGIKIKEYHSDNGIFSSKEFKQHCKSLGQKQSFSGVGAKFQNAVAENGIKTVSSMARANMIHAQLHWPGRSFIDFWPLAMSYATWVYNRLPLGDGPSPEEVWTKIKCPESHLPRAHAFGCPVYVLDPKLQDGGKIPKWDSKARQGIFVGFSPEHSTNVPLIYNITTQHISPQFHVIFDDEFSTVPALTSIVERDETFEHLFETSTERFVDEDDLAQVPDLPLDENGDIIEGSSMLDDEWLSLSQLLHRNERRPTPASESDNEVPEGVTIRKASEGVQPIDGSRPIRRARDSTWRDGPVASRPSKKSLLANLLLLPQMALSAMHNTQPPPAVANIRGPHGKHMHKRVLLTQLDEAVLLSSDWSDMGNKLSNGFGHCFSAYVKSDLADEVGSFTVTDLEPHFLKAKLDADPDQPTYRQAINSPQADMWWDAMEVELDTLENDLKVWDLVYREAGMNVLPSTWAFKLKRFPDGLAKKFKARFCARGDRQKFGIDYFETWAPVVQWTTVRSMLILSTKLNLLSTQADITAAFVHADLEGPPVYVEQPKGHERVGPNGEPLVLKLNKCIYGLRQSSRCFFNYLKDILEDNNVKQSELDPCLFIGKNVIVVVYVDDLLLFSKDDAEFDRLIASIKTANVAIRREGTAEGFLGVDIKREDTASGSQITLLQIGLTQRIISALGLSSSLSTKIGTPAEVGALPKDADGLPALGNFSYPSVIGMLLYLTGHSRPDISFAVHQCARYTFKPTRRHEAALIRIGRYLKGTADKGHIMCPTDDPCIDTYPDSDFAGLYSFEDSKDPHCAHSRTGFVILAFGCPILWKSKLQTEIALSTMEAEYVALSTAMKDLIPLIGLLRELRAAVGLPVDFDSNLHCRVHEDNAGALILANMEPRHYTPRSKHYAIKYHWFREKMADPGNRIKVVKIDTRNQLGDLFTKGLPKPAFTHLRRLLMGW